MESPQQSCGGAEVLLNLRTRTSVSVGYHPQFAPHDELFLLELDEKLLPDVLYQRVSLRGQSDEEAVLCTKSKTYAIKFVGTSNSVFLVPPSNHLTDCEKSQSHAGQKIGVPIIKVASGNMELVEVAPRIDKLRSILLETPYFSDEGLEMDALDAESMKRLYNWDDLTTRIQASDDELRTALQALKAVEIDGYWRIVDEKYMDMILRMLLHNAVLNEWSLDALVEEEVVRVMESDGFSFQLTCHCLRVYGSNGVGVDRNIWKMDDRKVSVHFAREILREGKMKMEAFMEKWTQKLPEGMQVSFSFLEGEVLTEKLGIETWIHAFSVSQLPSTPAERFSVLFKERPKWEWKALQPYIRDLNVPGLSSDALLLKYTRKTQPTANAEPVFSAR